MATEIERKFLVLNEDWRAIVESDMQIVQAYLATNEFSSTRIRIQGDKANINIKSATLGITRTEFEYAIPVDDAQLMIDDLCIKPVIEKTRYIVKHMQHRWEIDVFSGDNKGVTTRGSSLPRLNYHPLMKHLRNLHGLGKKSQTMPATTTFVW